MTYGQKLKDPRWQKKRLEVMENAGFKCQTCGDSTKTLNVHHVNYRKGAEPWEYGLSDLACVCEDCHEKIEDSINHFRRIVVHANPDSMKLVMDMISGSVFASESVGSTHDDPYSMALEILHNASAELKARAIADTVLSLYAPKSCADRRTELISDICGLLASHNA